LISFVEKPGVDMSALSPMPTTSHWVGASVPRVDAPSKVTGRALYPGDLRTPGMLHMKILFAGRPHAAIRRINTSVARAAPGVVAVFTGADVPVNAYGLAFSDQPVLCDRVVRFEGDQVAVVVAETEAAAARGRDLIDVEYADLPALTDPRRSMSPGAPAIHDDHPDNVLDHIRIRKGDAMAALAGADAVVESSYYLPMQEHAYLQPEAGLAYMDGDVVVVETAGQWAHHDQRQIAAGLGLSAERVRVIYRAIGGAFGGREDISVQLALALAAWKTGRPVKVVWSREESIRGHCKRHQMFITCRWGATRNGKVIAADADLISDAGAYAFTSTMVLGHAALTATGVYDIPNVRVDAYAVYTNNVPGGAFRGFGSPQGIFAAELQMDKLAEAIGMDPVSLRERNLVRPGALLSVGTPLPESIHLGELLTKCAQTAGWTRAASGSWRRPAIGDQRSAISDQRSAISDQRTAIGDQRSAITHQPSSIRNPQSAIRNGFGLALGFKNIGFSFGYPEASTTTIELRGDVEIEEAVVRFAGAECGQGVQTAISQMAAEALGVPMDRIRLIGADTAQAPEAGSASASRLTLMGGNAVIGAAREALARWRDEERPAVATFTYHAPETTDFDPDSGHGKPHVVFSPVAQAATVDVDVETGQVSVRGVVTAVDVGQAINPAQVNGQVHGAVAQAVGYATLENFVVEDGRILTPNLSTYLIPTALDVPHSVESLVLENPDPVGPWGARGVGETPFIALAPAVASAVYDATGVWFDALPLTPQAVLAGLRNGGARPSDEGQNFS
jgi:CO/xanthine dehydrogenase Mo-binding subunit